MGRNEEVRRQAKKNKKQLLVQYHPLFTSHCGSVSRINNVPFWVTQCIDRKDSQGAELRHVVETGDWNTSDVVVVQRAARERRRNIEKEREEEEKEGNNQNGNRGGGREE